MANQLEQFDSDVARAVAPLFRFITNKAPLVLLLVIAISIFAVMQVYDFKQQRSKIVLDPSVNSLLPQNDPELEYYQQTKQAFGNDEILIALLTPNSGGSVLTSASGKAVEDLHNSIADIPSVNSVQSLASVGLISDPDFEYESVAEYLQQNVSRKFLENTVLNDPLLPKNFVSEDARSAIMLIQLDNISEDQYLTGSLLNDIETKLKQQQHFKVQLTGTPIIKRDTADTLYEELGSRLALIIAILAFLLIIAFPNFRAVFVTVLTISLGTLWTLAIIQLLGLQLNLVTSLVPPIVITLGLAYTLHMISEYFQSFEDVATETRKQRVYQVLSTVSLPLIITAFTTIAGLLALLTNPLLAVKQFALMASIGVAISAGLTLTFIPAALIIGANQRRPKPPRGNQFFTLLSNFIATFDIAQRKNILRGGIALLLVALFSTQFINVGSRYVGTFPEESSTRSNYEAVNQAVGGANIFNIVIESHVPDGILSYDVLLQLEQLENWLVSQPEIGQVTGISSYLKALNQGFTDGSQDQYKLPMNSQQAKQLLVFAGGDDIERVIDLQFRRSNIIVRCLSEDTAVIGKLKRRIKTQIAALTKPLSGHITGSSIIATRTVEDIAKGQLSSILIALAVIYIMLSGLFTSWKTGAFALLPNVIPIALYFGTLSLTGITLNPTTSLIACLILGIAVDDTVHYLVRFNADARNSADEHSGTLKALNGVIRPITFTSFTLIFGFLVFTGSSLSNQVEFGLLAAFTMLMAWLTDIIFTPALASNLKIVTLWDVLRLDLGKNPQQSIPLLNGLTLRQARTFALLANIQNRKQGARIITKGNDARNIYVIIDGEMEAWVHDENGNKVSLSTMKRGAVLGEVGYFNSKRTANVDATTKVRLLRFSEKDMDRLRRRRPFIAAIIYRNLNRIQAQRLARTTDLVSQKT